MTKDNYLVTGSEGFVGFNLSNYIKKLGHNVFGIDFYDGRDNLKNWRKSQLNNAGVKTFNVDISDKYQILDFENNIAKIFENVRYEGSQGSILSDNIKINLITKKIDIYMDNENDKVQLNKN